jgi:hypothetical protein
MTSSSLSSSAKGPGSPNCPIQCLLPKIFCIIIDFIIKGACQALLSTTQMPAIARVSCLFWAAYFQYKSKNDFGIKAYAMPTNKKQHKGVLHKKRLFWPQIKKTLSFSNLKTIAKYFTNKPSYSE